MSAPPVVWALLGDKAGDNAQVEAVIERLPWPVERRFLRFKPPFVKGKPPFMASLYHVDSRRSDALAPPWPDLVLTIGRRPAMAALWIRRRSGDRTRIVLFGRPKRHPRHFALIVVSSQFLVERSPNVLATTLPLMRVDEARLDDARAQWHGRFAALPRPIVAVLVGGATRPYAFGAAEARELLARATRYADGGTLYVTTSRRTGGEAVSALVDALPPGAVLWRWGDASPNPYLALLALADAFVVTGDSMSMITEVARLGRPLAIYPLPLRPMTRFARELLPGWLAGIPARLKYHWLPRLGFTAFPRDLTEIHRLLFEQCLAVPAGEPLPACRGPVEDEIQKVVDAVVTLFPSR